MDNRRGPSSQHTSPSPANDSTRTTMTTTTNDKDIITRNPSTSTSASTQSTSSAPSIIAPAYPISKAASISSATETTTQTTIDNMPTDPITILMDEKDSHKMDAVPSSQSPEKAAAQPAKAKKLIYFEGLRGIAALVPIFFILSGGIVTRSILQANATGSQSTETLLKKLYSSVVRRPFRLLFPLYFGTLYKCMLIKYFGLKTDKDTQLPESGWELVRRPLEFLFYEDQQPYLPVPAWTLYPEMIGSLVVYIVTAVLLPYANNPRIRYTTLIPMIVFFFFTDNFAFYFLIGYTISDMTVSGYTAKFNSHRHSTLIKILLLLFSIAVTFEFSDKLQESDPDVSHPNPLRSNLLHFFQTSKIHSVERWTFPTYSLLIFYCTTIFFLIETTPILQTLLSTAPITYLGRISFMLYLTHMDTAKAVTPLSEKWLEQGTQGYWAKFLFDTGMCILVADLATRFFDEPVQKVVKRAEKLVLHDGWYLLPVRAWPGFLGERVGRLPGYWRGKVVAWCQECKERLMMQRQPLLRW
ncbi:hypothetical protein HDU97_005258 [Phlyctochytrium planicorne]|nr:hypothetical protein HDU97_005258 [Phlyctochytrium planicorne]